MKPPLFRIRTALALAILVATHAAVFAQSAKTRTGYGAASIARDREIAAQFAPVFYQGIGDERRADLITKFDFDGDWRGDNNWANAGERRFKMPAYVYYAVSETPTHFFIHYAVFHARDYKGGGTKGALLGEAMREGVRLGGRYDPTGLSSEAVLAHENDMEGCLVVAAKSGEDPARARVVYVETLGHDRFQKYAAATEGFKGFETEGVRPLLYVEPKGHGVSAYGDERRRKDAPEATADAREENAQKWHMLVYRYAGRAGDAEAVGATGEVGYDLLPLYTTLWPRARRGANETFGVAQDFGALDGVPVLTGAKPAARRVSLGKLGSAFRGKVGAVNAARPPWGWFDRGERDAPRGSWFFDPAATVKRHFRAGADLSTSYTHAPFIGVFRR